MEYAAGGLAVLGALVGLRFRYRALLPIIVGVFLVSLLFLLPLRLGLLKTLAAALAAQALLQCGYFGGLIIRFMFKAAQRRLARSSSEKCRSS